MVKHQKILTSLRSSKDQLLGFFTNKGNKLQVLKQLSFVYLNFLRNFHGLNSSSYLESFFNLNSLDLGEFIKLYASYPLFRDFQRALHWRLNENLPLIKCLVIKKKMKKKKKILKKKKFIYTYRYVIFKNRQQIITRWVGMLSKIYNKKYIVGFHSSVIPFIVKPANTKIPQYRVKVYSGVLTSWLY